jgi:hypothetical protein
MHEQTVVLKTVRSYVGESGAWQSGGRHVVDDSEFCSFALTPAAAASP